jgi:hypothetical protein
MGAIRSLVNGLDASSSQLDEQKALIKGSQDFVN